MPVPVRRMLLTAEQECGPATATSMIGASTPVRSKLRRSFEPVLGSFKPLLLAARKSAPAR
jgi:hypothetical protein